MVVEYPRLTIINNELSESERLSGEPEITGMLTAPMFDMNNVQLIDPSEILIPDPEEFIKFADEFQEEVENNMFIRDNQTYLSVVDIVLKSGYQFTIIASHDDIKEKYKETINANMHNMFIRNSN